MCYSGSIGTISSEIVALPWTSIRAKFLEDISSNEEVTLQGHDVDRSICMQLYAIVIGYRRFQQMSRFLGRKGRVRNFRSISQKLTYTDGYG